MGTKSSQAWVGRVALAIVFGLVLFCMEHKAVMAAQSSDYRLLAKVTLGGEGAWDYLAIDPEARQLYISRWTHVMVVDADNYKVTGDITDTQGVHGIAIAREFGRGFTSDGATDQVTIFDLKTHQVIGTVRTGKGPDGIIYDPASKRIFAFNGDAGTATAIDAASGNVAGNVNLGGSPEFAAADNQGHIYNNLRDRNEVVQIDSKALKVLNHWSLAPGSNPAGIAIDTPHRRLFVGCRNAMMIIVDADTGKVVTHLPIGHGVDAIRFDPKTQFVFSSNGDGTLTIVHEDSPDKYSVVDNVPTQREGAYDGIGSTDTPGLPGDCRAWSSTTAYRRRPSSIPPDKAGYIHFVRVRSRVGALADEPWFT